VRAFGKFKPASKLNGNPYERGGCLSNVSATQNFSTFSAHYGHAGSGPVASALSLKNLPGRKLFANKIWHSA
jgi:hypothetical protein